ncbi:MAG: RHS repeat-associated core domain-containing protein [Chloroflexota bacterium]
MTNDLYTSGLANVQATVTGVGGPLTRQALNSYLFDGQVLNATVHVGAAWKLLTSDNGGQSWNTPIALAAGWEARCLTGWPSSQQYLLVSGTNTLAYTTDRGTSWTNLWSGFASFASGWSTTIVTALVGLPPAPTHEGPSLFPICIPCLLNAIFSDNPIKLQDGDKFEEATDLTLNSPAGPLTFARTYRQSKLSNTNYQVMGLGWTHSHNFNLTKVIGTPNTVIVRMPNGGEAHFTETTTNHFEGDPGSASFIDFNTGTSQYTLTAMDTSTYVFNTSGQLVSRAWPSHETWTYTYTSSKLSQVADGYGRQLNFTYVSNPGQYNDGQLWRVGDQTASGLSGGSPTGTYVELTYTPEKNNGTTVSSPKALLASVRDVLGHVWTYDYYGQHSGESSTNQLNFITQRRSPSVDTTGDGTPDGALTLESLVYTLSGATITNITQQNGIQGAAPALRQTDFAFQPGGQSITTETVANKTTTHQFANSLYLGSQDAAGNGGSQTPNFQYRPELQKDANGNTTLLQWSADGKQVTKVNDALGNQTNFHYNSGGAADATLDYSLDAQGRKTQYSYTDTTNNPRLPTEVKVFDTNGTTVLQWQKFTYDTKGRTLTEKTLDPADATGNTVKQQITRVYYSAGNGNGLLNTVTQKDVGGSNDVTTTYSYDSAGRTVKTQQSQTFGGCTIAYTVYDAAGNVVASICNYDPGVGADPTTAAQAAALYSTAAPEKNHVTTYAYDTLNRRVATTTDAGAPHAKTTLSVYDALNRVIRTISNYVVDAGIPNPYTAVRTAFQHGADNTQNLISETTYNERGLVSSSTDVVGNVTLYGYDDADRLIKTVQNASQPSYNNSYAGDPSLSSYVPGSAVDQDLISTSTYDAAGNLVKQVDVLGHTSFMVYDPLNRPVKTVRSAQDGARVDLNPGDAGYTAASDPRSEGYAISSAPDRDLIDLTEYDSLGRVIRSRDTLGTVTLYGYDALGRQGLVIRSASQPTYNLLADPSLSGYILSSTADLDIVSNNQYDAAGRTIKTVDALGTWTLYGYDGLGRQVKVVRSASLPTYNLTADPSLSNYVPSTNPDQDLVTSSTYDLSGQLMFTTDVLGRKTWYAYDSLSRATRTVVNAVGTATDGGVQDPRSANYNPVVNQSDRDRISLTTYDVPGHVLYITDAWGRKNWSGYDVLDRPIRSVSNALGTATDGGTTDPRSPAYVVNSAADVDLVNQTAYDLRGLVTSTTDTQGRVTRYVYDQLGRRIQTIFNYMTGTYNPVYPDRDLTSTTVYNRGGQVLSTTDARGTQTAFTYDRAGRRLTTTRAANTQLATTSYVCYDKGGRVLRVIDNYHSTPTTAAPDARDAQGNWRFNLPGNPYNLITVYTYDQLGRPIAVTDPQGNTSSTTYYKDGQPESRTDAAGSISKYRYDRARRRQKVVQAYNASTFSDPANWSWTGAAWSDGVAAITFGGDFDRNSIVQMDYDKAGRTLAIRDPRGNRTTYTYDRLDRRTSLTDPLTHTWATAYTDLNGGATRTELTDPLTFVTRRDTDRVGRLASVAYLNESTKLTPDVTFSYNKLGNRLGMSESNGTSTVRNTTYGYDNAQRLTSVGFDTDGNGTIDQTVSYQYDAGGLRTQLTLPDGKTVTYQYNAKGQLIGLTDWASQQTTYSYDSADRLAGALHANGLQSNYDYDATGRLRRLRHTSGGQTLGHFAYTLDARGNRTQAFEAVAQNGSSLMSTIAYNDPAVNLYSGTWSPVNSYQETNDVSARVQIACFGRQATLTMGQGNNHSIYDVYVDGDLWQTFDGYAASAGPAPAVTIPFSADGPHVIDIRNRAEKNLLSSAFKLRFKTLSVTGQPADVQTIRYTYDALSRLQEAKYYPGVNTLLADANLPRRYQYDYDVAGNRTQQVVTLAGTPTTTSYTYDNANRLVSDGTHTFAYDVAGRMTSDGVNTYTWDRANRLLSMGGSAYLYNGLGQRVQQTVSAQVTQYLLDVQPGLERVLTATQSTNVTRYVHGPLGLQQQLQPDGTTWRWSILDGLGSVRGVVDNTAVQQESRLYSPFGEVYATTGSSQTVFGFTGEPTDGNGLVQLRARYYNPALGVFPSLDPLEGTMQQPMTLNRYGYVNGNPVNLVDPSGMVAEADLELLRQLASCSAQQQQNCSQTTFTYSRDEAAQYAVDNSRAMLNLFENDLKNFSISHVTDRGVSYNFIKGTPGSTASALFVSESMHFGGKLPLTKTWNYDLKGNASRAWRTHLDLIQYIVSLGATTVGNIDINPKYQYSSANRSPYFVDANGVVDTKNIGLLYGYLLSIQSVRKGDYFFDEDLLNPVNDHGTVVVGWGPLANCGDVSARENQKQPYALADRTDLDYHDLLEPSQMMVPYVADNNYGVTRAGGPIGHLQDTRPRPFYCLKAKYADFFGGTKWRFYRMPDSITVPCNQQYQLPNN